MAILFLVIALTFNAIANILLKIGSGNLSAFREQGLWQGLRSNGLLLVGIGLFALNVIFYAFSLSKLNLSFAYPLMVGGGFLIITLFSFWSLKETITPWHLVGIFLLFAGILLISLNKS